MATQFQKVEYPIRGIRSYGGNGTVSLTPTAKWTISNVLTGQPLESVTGPDAEIKLVLDGDHILTKDLRVISVSKWEETQDLEELRDFFDGLSEEDRTSWPEDRKFVSLPAPKRYAYAASYTTREVFDPNRQTKKLIAFSDGFKSISIWDWEVSKTSSDGKLVENSTFSFDHPLYNVTPLPETSQVLGDDEVAIMFDESFIIFNVETQETLREFHFGPIEEMGDIEFFILPDGRLCFSYVKRGTKHITDVTQVLEQGEEDFIEMKAVDIPEIVQFAHPSDDIYIQASDGDLLFLLAYDGKPWLVGREGNKNFKEVKVEGEVLTSEEWDLIDFFCRCSFHGSDVAYVRMEDKGKWSSEKESQLVFVNLETGKTKQVLNFPNAPYHGQSLATHLPGNKYLMGVFPAKERGEKRLIEYHPHKGKYALGPTSIFDFLLPTSRAEKEAMRSYLDKAFLDAKAPVPKEIVGIVSNFI